MVLVIGGVLIGLQLSKGTTTINPSPTTASTLNTSNTPTGTQITPTSQSPGGATATSQPTSVPTTQQTGGVPKGAVLYTASRPGKGCDTGGGKWFSSGVTVACLIGPRAEISNTQQSTLLGGAFLSGIPSNSSFPNDYIVEAQLQQSSTSHADFGIYFRSQPGNNQGTYTFLIHPDGTWHVYVYDNATGNQTAEIDHGTLGNAYALVTLDIVVVGSNFTFYANNQRLDSVSDGTYSTGFVGIAVDQNGGVVVGNFALYQPA